MPGPTLLVWLFNLWGAADLLFAGLQGRRLGIDPGAFGAAFFLPTAIVPLLLVTHAPTFGLLVTSPRRREPQRARAAAVLGEGHRT